MDDRRSQSAAGLSETGRASSYDPTQNPLPSGAIRAPPGERQIAYPPEFPRAKIHATPEGTTSVHIGVRPRAHPLKDGPVAAREEQQRRPGYGELGSESDADSRPTDDGRAHDGIYTYDYGDDEALPVGGAAQGTRVRAHPPPPTVAEENAYGVPFGKRLKAMINLRREAEEKGLQLSLQSEQSERSVSVDATSQGKVRRKPVPRYVQAGGTPTNASPAGGTAGEGETAVIGKQKSEPEINEDAMARAARREKRRREKEIGRKGEGHYRSQSEQPPPTSAAAADDPYNMPLMALSLRSQSVLEGATPHAYRTSPVSTRALVPPMPEGEEYDSETEAERQAAWEEYYRLMSMYDGAPPGGGGGFAAPLDQETTHGYSFPDWADSQTPGYPYNVGAVPEFAAGGPGKMPAVRPPMGMGMGMGVPMYTGQPQPPMFYGFQHPGMMPQHHPGMGAEYGPMAPGVYDDGAMMEPAAAASVQRHPGVPIAGPPLRTKPPARPVPPDSDSRRDVRFAGVAEAPPKLAPRHSGYSGWRYPAQAGYMSSDHTPASSVLTSPTGDAPDPMDAYSPRGSYAQHGYYGYSPYPSYPNTPSVNSAAGYNAQADPFTFEEMSTAVQQVSLPKQKSEQNLQDRRKKSWYGPRQ
ncbi:hypothetical protein QFC19_009514 [Naganishia cerealis]|uniref:Uncharacterized protein n=1 Tax=Naganishia cerealis TaxID=610337 RepID=A0ACC2UVZ1_9TREE|nr:hypothetical protein QFC19_009514 [Naganishia cerealis]